MYLKVSVEGLVFGVDRLGCEVLGLDINAKVQCACMLNALSLPHPHTCLHVGPAHRGMTRVFPRPRHAPHWHPLPGSVLQNRSRRRHERRGQGSAAPARSEAFALLCGRARHAGAGGGPDQGGRWYERTRQSESVPSLVCSVWCLDRHFLFLKENYIP